MYTEHILVNAQYKCPNGSEETFKNYFAKGAQKFKNFLQFICRKQINFLFTTCIKERRVSAGRPSRTDRTREECRI